MSCTGKLLPIRARLELADRSIDRPDPPEQLQLPDLAQAVAEDAKSAFVTGLHAAAAVASVLHVALGVLALRWLPRVAAARPDAVSYAIATSRVAENGHGAPGG
jgi:hypothetical protein